MPERISVYLPRQLAEAVRAQARGSGARSVSAFVAEILRGKLGVVRLGRDELQDVLAEIFGDHPMTDEERAWADSLLFAP
jgi:hypothetical protein